MDSTSIPQLTSPHGQFHWAPDAPRALIRFQEAWLSLKPDQMREIGDTIGHFLSCPFGHHFLESGMILCCAMGEYRMPLTEESARELFCLLNDGLLLMEATRAVG